MTEEEKYKRLYQCLNKWLKCSHEEKNIAEFLRHKDISTVAIYGYGALGKNAVSELSMQGISPLWIMDRKKLVLKESYKTYTADQMREAEEPEMVLITSVTSVEEIEKNLRECFSCLIISIEELIDCMSEWGNAF